MLGLPKATETNRQLPKTLVYKQFGLTAQQRDHFDADISRMSIVNVVSPDTVPALAAGESVKSFYVLAVTEVVAFVNDHKVIIAPVDMREVKTVGPARVTRQVSMEQNVVA
jgi:hypothetical protein